LNRTEPVQPANTLKKTTINRIFSNPKVTFTHQPPPSPPFSTYFIISHFTLHVDFSPLPLLSMRASPTEKVKEEPKEKSCTFSFLFVYVNSNRVAKLTVKIAVEYGKSYFYLLL